MASRIEPSRQELVAWVNNLLNLNFTKVEEMGKGAALCQIYDSIWQDLPMHLVKFDAKTYPEYFGNLKILQGYLKDKNIKDINIDIGALSKCKMLDNLAFLKKTKIFWDTHYQGPYDPVSRRAAVPADAGPTSKGLAAAAARRGVTPTATARAGSSAGNRGLAATASIQLKQENAVLKENIVGLERERDFYFGKLRDIELLIQQALEEDPTIDKDDDGLIKQIQNVLYSTEDGFEIPAEGEAGAGAESEPAEGLDDQETF